MTLPKRPRSHQIEDRSVTAFRASMPERWVVREKNNDYGIDVEVEIFDEEDVATGAIFFVQLKATDAIFTDDEDNLQINISTLEYYKALDCPVLIARYSVPDDKFLYLWSHEIHFEKKRQDQKKITIKFRKFSWSDFTPTGIQKTVLSIRELRKLSDEATLPFNLAVVGVENGVSKARLRRFVRQFIQSASGFSYENYQSAGSGQIVIDCKLDKDLIFFSVNGLYPTTIQLPLVDVDNIEGLFLYSLCTFLQRIDFQRKALAIAKTIFEKDLIVDNRALVYRACVILLPEAEKAIKLAILNRLQSEIDPWNMLFVNRLIAVEGIGDLYREYTFAMIEAISQNAPYEVVGPLYYNLANNLRCHGEFREAIKYYNMARKLRPEYEETPYFIQEVGACCFLTGKYAAAVSYYRKLFDLDASNVHRFFLADAMLFAGRLQDSHEQFSQISFENVDTTAFEASIKLRLIEWLREFTSSGTVKRDRIGARQIYASFEKDKPTVSFAVLEQYCKEVDPLDPLINFNFAQNLALNGDTEKAIMHYLVTAFTDLRDGQAWANAIACGIGSKQVPNDFMLALISLAVYYAESELLEAWDEINEANEVPIETIESFDHLIEEVSKIVLANRKENVSLMRILQLKDR